MSEKLIDEFLKNRSNSIDNSVYDEKHKKIIKNVDLKKDIKKFRNWDFQNDMGLNYRLGTLPKIFLNYYRVKLISSLFEVINKRINHYFEFSSLLDDIQVIEKIGGEKLLKENPQNKTPGAINYPLIKGYSVSTRWLRYIYLLKQLQNHNLISNNSIWLDVGSYYGGLQGLVKKYYPNAKIILIDFEHQLIRSYIYLKNLYPESFHVLPGEINKFESFDNLPNGCIVYIDQKDFDSIKHFNIDLFTNFFSLGEMKKVTFFNYLRSDIYLKSKFIYMANRFSSSPFFDKTYDDQINIFDYKTEKRSLIYFDILPINHYQIIYRKLFGRKFFRNISSPYFEMILKK